MKFLSDILAKAGLTVDGVVTLNNTATGQTPAANDNSTKLATTAWVRTFVQPYSLPIASASVLGGIKVGTGLSIDAITGVLSAVAGGSASIKSTQTFTATAGQTVFTITGGYTVGLIDVFLNGVYLSPNQTTATNGTTVTLGEAAAAGDIIDVIIASPVYQGATTTTDQLPEGVVNLYYTNARARAAISLTVTGTSGASTYDSATGVLNVPTYTLAGLGGVPTGRTITIDGVSYDLSANRTWNILPTGGATGDILAKSSATNYDVAWIPNYTSQVQHQVKLGATMTAGTAVYVSSSTGNAGTNMIVSKASNAAEGTSSKTLGLIATGGVTNDTVFVVTEGLLAGLDTSTASAGDPVWLGVNGGLIFGLLNKPTAPAHLVFIGVVTRAQQNNGEIFVKVQNGFELDELHNVSAQSPSDGDMIKYVASTGLWTKIAASTTNIVEGTNLYYTQSRFNTAFSGKSTTDLAEGTNLYYTQSRFDTAFAAKSTSNLTEGTNLYYTQARFDTAFAAKSTTNLTEGTNLYYTTARVNTDFDTRLATKSTTNLAEGTNLYYTDARVGSYLSTNSYATQSYVSTQINNLISGAPGLLDTLDELAAALGDDPNFATTVSTALSNRLRIDVGTQGLTSTQQGYGRTNLGLGSLATLSSIGNSYITDLAWSKLTGVPTTISGYGITDSLVYTTGTYSNPAWITALAWSKITGAPAFLTSYTETDTLANVTSRGATTSTAVTFSGGASISSLLINGAPAISESSLSLGAMGTTEGGQLTLNKATSYTYAAHIDIWNDNLRFLYGTNTVTSGVAMALNLSTRQLILPLYTASNSFTGTAAGVLAFDTSGNIITIAVPGGSVSSVNAGTGVSVNQNTGAVTVSIGQSVATSATPSFDKVFLTNNGSGTNLKVGDDVWIGDVNQTNTLGIVGQQDSTSGYISFGSDYATKLGRTGTGALTWNGNNVYHAGNLTNLNQLTNGPGYITGITSSNVTTALGFTPYNSTNPNGYISSYTETSTLAQVTARGASTTAAITISREAFGYSGTTQSFLIDGAGGNAALTINAASAYAYLNFAQTGTTKFEIGVEGAATNKGSLYFNHNIQVGSTGAAMYIKKSNGYIGMGTIDPSYKLHIYTSDNEGIYLQGTGGGIWMNIKSASGKMWSYGAQNDGCGIYNRTDGAYRFFITDGGTIQLPGQVIQGGGSSRSTYGTTIAFTRNTAFSSNSDVGDGERFFSIVNESTTAGAMSLLSFRINPSGTGSSNIMMDNKLVNNGSNTSTLYWTFNHSAVWGDKMSLTSSGNLGIVGTLTTTVDASGASITAQNNGTANRWYGRIGSFNSSSDKSAFIGTYASVAVVGAHNNALTAWANLYVNNVDGSNGGNVYLPVNTYIATNVVIHAGNVGSYALSASGGTMTGGLTINTPSNSVGSALTLYSTSYHQYLRINSNGAIEAMVHYNNNESAWYVGIRTSAQLVGSTGFHFYNTTSAQTVGGYTIGGAHYSLGSSYANGNRLVENTGTWSINVTGSASSAFGMGYDGNAISGMGSISNWDSRPGVGYAGFGINWHTGVTLSGYPGYGGVRLYASGYPTHAGSVLRLEASYAVYTYGGLYSDGNLVLHAGNYTSYTDGRYWFNNGSWYADFGSYSFSRIFGNETSGGGFAIMTNPNNGGQTSILIDGSYFAGENGGHWSLNSANNYTSRFGFYHDGSTMNFRTNNAVMSTANIRVYPVSESWAEGISFIMPTTGVWGGLRWQRQRGTNDGNWYFGYTALDSSDDLVFGANNAGAQVNSIIRMSKSGYVTMQQAPGGANLFLGPADYSRVYDDSARNSLVINASYYPHLYINATAGDASNATHGAVISMTGRLSSGGYRRWSMGIGNYDPSYFSIGWYDNNTNPHYGVGHSWGPGGKFIIDTSGNIWCTGDVTAYGAASDSRLKNIKGKVDNALEGILKLNGYRFDWKERDVKIVTFKEDIGVIAQEVVDVFPELARTNDDGYMSVRYQGLTAVLIEAVKEQQTQIESQKTEIEELKDLVKQLINR